ncbi:MAG: hypothetical protein NT007_14145 [Candidatus Kapabacteria bacterium]|nr:hypothetical protein [Candidatus Kapabacteria bacterium]
MNLHAESDSSRKITLEFNIGISSNIDSSVKHFDRTGLAYSGRIMWEPEHLLRIGIYSASINIARYKQNNVKTQYGITNVDNSLGVYPIILVFNMKIWVIDLYSGIGPAYLWSSITAFNETSTSYEWDYAISASIAYKYKIKKHLYLNSELEYLALPEIFKNIYKLSVGIKYDLYEW